MGLSTDQSPTNRTELLGMGSRSCLAPRHQLQSHMGAGIQPRLFTLNRGCVHFRKGVVLIASYLPVWGGRASYPEVTEMASRRTLNTAHMRWTALYQSRALTAGGRRHRVACGVMWRCAQEQ